MLRAYLPSTNPISIPVSMILGVARCWRRAADESAPRQQRLYAHLDTQDCGLLAPVFDGLLMTIEAATGRRLVMGEGERRSQDEVRLLDLIAGVIPVGPLRHHALGSTLDVALRSARLMMTLVLETAKMMPDGRPIFFVDGVGPDEKVRAPGLFA